MITALAIAQQTELNSRINTYGLHYKSDVTQMLYYQMILTAISLNNGYYTTSQLSTLNQVLGGDTGGANTIPCGKCN